ncbi:virulence protein E, partial [Lactiplantibacillus plantarum]
VAKAHNPKTKFDFVLDLVGGQGAGKTTFLQKIAPLGYYTDQFSTFDNKDDYAVMRRALIINDDEMTATNNASF